ncbi:MAG: ankyrin repeat domain-containing protein [Candidatus Sulfotelmatobacter sp.]
MGLLFLAFLGHACGLIHLHAQQINSLDGKLFRAIDNNDIIAVEHVLRDGANIEARETNGTTPLMDAAEHGSVPLVSLLLESGADVSTEDGQSETALIYAARGGWVHVVNLIVRLVGTKEKNRALFEAVEGGPVVIKTDDAPAHPTRLQSEPAEVQESWTASVENLLDNGADIKARNQDGSTPLDWAAAFAQTDAFRLLMQRGAKTNVRDNYGNTPLISAACECAVATMNSAYDVMKILLDQGANVNARNKDGKTALIMASGMTGDAAVLDLLLKNGADPQAKDHKGNTALSLAKQSRRDDKVAILKTVTVH